MSAEIANELALQFPLSFGLALPGYIWPVNQRWILIMDAQGQYQNIPALFDTRKIESRIPTYVLDLLGRRHEVQNREGFITRQDAYSEDSSSVSFIKLSCRTNLFSQRLDTNFYVTNSLREICVGLEYIVESVVLHSRPWPILEMEPVVDKSVSPLKRLYR